MMDGWSTLGLELGYWDSVTQAQYKDGTRSDGAIQTTNSGFSLFLSTMAVSSLHHLDDYKRYGRQMILDGIGLPGAFWRDLARSLARIIYHFYIHIQ